MVGHVERDRRADAIVARASILTITLCVST